MGEEEKKEEEEESEEESADDDDANESEHQSVSQKIWILDLQFNLFTMLMS
jgi:hypothetical protein